PSDNAFLYIFSINGVTPEKRLSHTDTLKSPPFILKICVEALSEPINCLCDLLPFLTRGHKIPKIVYYIGAVIWAVREVVLDCVYVSHDFCTTCPRPW
ncbi:hypothetical protein KSS87_021119, partial [Heliosperma pusillum]